MRRLQSGCQAGEGLLSGWMRALIDDMSVLARLILLLNSLLAYGLLGGHLVEFA